MESSSDKEWAHKYLIDPLNAPEPSEETGPGSHFRSSVSANTKGPTATVSRSSKTPSATVTSYPTPPSSASPTRGAFHPSNPFAASASSPPRYTPSHRQSAFGGYANSSSTRRSLDEPKSSNGKGRQRTSSLGERYPGDRSHRPLDQLRKETKTAHRAPHLKKRHMIGPDIIDNLDDSSFGPAYHHGGPYDATLLARNTSWESSPVAAVQSTNEEALRATPRENIQDSLDRHVPLIGTAGIPSGMPGPDGRIMNYEEGADLMREPDAPGGAYKRWEGIQYHPEDYKGKGEPSFTIEKALKDHERNSHRRVLSDGNSAYEMQTRPSNTNARQRSASGSHAGVPSAGNQSARYSDFEGGLGRSNTTGKRVGEGLKRRLGSLRRSFKHSDS